MSVASNSILTFLNHFLELHSLVVYFCYVYLLIDLCGCEVEPFSTLSVSVYRVTSNGAEIDWQQISNQVQPQQQSSASADRTRQTPRLAYCELIYGPLSTPLQVEVFSNFIPERHSLLLTNLTFNVSYHFHMLCYDQNQIKYKSNTVTFTPGIPGSEETASDLLNQQHGIVATQPRGSGVFNSFYRPDRQQAMGRISGDGGPYITSGKNISSGNIMLGAACGVIGFLIINVTVVMVMKRCSYWRMRRRHALEIEEPDEVMEGFLYLRNEIE